MADSLNAHIQAYVQPGGEECYAYAVALFYYSPESGYKHITRHLKYEHGVGLGRSIASVLGEKLAQASRFADVDAVIPVPLYWSRRLKRGYNQAEIIAKELARKLDAPLVTDVLVRRRSTSTQTRLSQEDRKKNISGAFVARGGHRLRHILLVDDVYTTGSTIAECFNALRMVFPVGTRISVATLAFVSH